jgi:hypothetical protein
MTPDLKFNRKTLPQELANCDEWPSCDISQLDPADLAIFEQRRNGLVAYLSGRPTAETASVYGIETSELLRYLNRCIAIMDDGHIAGWAGLLKGFRKHKPIRSKPVCTMPSHSFGGYTGALSALLASHPDVHMALDR